MGHVKNFAKFAIVHNPHPMRTSLTISNLIHGDFLQVFDPL